MFLINKYIINDKINIKFHFDIYNKILKNNDKKELSNYLENYK